MSRKSGSSPRVTRFPSFLPSFLASFCVVSQTGSDIEPFEVELLSDVEGASEKKRPGSGADPGDVAPSENDAWMRNIWGAENRAVVMSYLCVGIALRFLATPISYYTVNVLGEFFCIVFCFCFSLGRVHCMFDITLLIV